MEEVTSSLFQTAPSLKFNVNNENISDDEEEIETRRRHNEELEEMVGNVFNEMTEFSNCFDEIEELIPPNPRTSGTSPLRSENNQRAEEIYPNNGVKEHQKENGKRYIDVMECKLMLESKCREINNIMTDYRKLESDYKNLEKKLQLSEMEKDRAQTQVKFNNELLVESKTKIFELEDKHEKLKQKISDLENENHELNSQLEHTRNLLANAEHKFLMVEKNVGLKMDRKVDDIVKQNNDRYAGQINMLQERINNLENKVEAKENDLKKLDMRYRELQMNHEKLLIDKSQTINELSRSLDESQKQCQKLMSLQDKSEENIRLQKIIASLEQQTEDMQKTINSLTAEINSTEAHLNFMDGLICTSSSKSSENSSKTSAGDSGACVNNDDDTNNNNNNNNNTANSFRKPSFNKDHLVGSTPVQLTDKLSHLKDELYRAINGQKEKREEIRKLKNQLTCKSDEIKKLKDEENKILVQLDMHREENVRLRNKLKLMEEEIELLNQRSNDGTVSGKCNSNPDKSIERNYQFTKDELGKYQEENRKLTKEINELRNELNVIRSGTENNRDELNAEIENLNSSLTQSKEELSSLRKNYELISKEKVTREEQIEELKCDLAKKSSLLDEMRHENDKLKTFYVELSNSKEILLNELNQAKECCKELEKERERNANLKGTIKLLEEKIKELEEALENEKKIQKIRENEKTDNLKSLDEFKNDCVKCVELMAKVTKLEIELLNIENQRTMYQRETENLRVQLDEAKLLAKEYGEKQDKTILELKEKALQFEEFMKNQENLKTLQNVQRSPHNSIKYRDQAVGTTKDLIDEYCRIVYEKNIQPEIIQFFENKIIEVKETYKKRLIAAENCKSDLSTEIKNIYLELESKQKEVNILKHTILLEREKIREILEHKDFQIMEAYQKIEQLNTYLNNKDSEVKQLQGEVNNLELKLQNESTAKNILLKQIEQLKALLEHNKDWKKTVKEIKEQCLNQQKEALEYAKKFEAQCKQHVKNLEKCFQEEYRLKVDKIKVNMECEYAKKLSQLNEKQGVKS